MIDLPTDEYLRLKNNTNTSRRVFHLISFTIDSVEYNFTNTDNNQVYDGKTFYAGYLADTVDDIETTSTPKTNDIKLEFDANEKTLVALFLSGSWMNAPLTIYERLIDAQGEISTQIIFQGYISAYSLNEPNRSIDVDVSSIWADFDKTTGRKTNPKSQQRFYPTDTGFRFASQADLTIYWGKEAPDTSYESQGGSSFDVPVYWDAE